MYNIIEKVRELGYKPEGILSGFAERTPHSNYLFICDVHRWLMEKYGINVSVCCWHHDEEHWYDYSIKSNEHNTVFSDKTYDTYGEAMYYGVQEAIELIGNKK